MCVNVLVVEERLVWRRQFVECLTVSLLRLLSGYLYRNTAALMGGRVDRKESLSLLFNGMENDSINALCVCAVLVCTVINWYIKLLTGLSDGMPFYSLPCSKLLLCFR